MLGRILRRSFCSSYQYLKSSSADGVAVVELNRPQALNALKDDLFHELNSCLSTLDQDPSIGCVVLTGAGPKAFAAGADIKEMKDNDYASVYEKNMLAHWEHITTVRTPIIAAVNGYALGGGCELALMCDIILASDKARFGLPEITLGTIPGCGGTQRLIRQVGKSKAMELILTGNHMSAQEAMQYGLVSQVYPADELLAKAKEMAQKIAGYSRPVARLAKESVNQAMESTLSAGIKIEKRNFHSTFALEDRREGMTAFAEKRKPTFKNK